MRCAIFLPDARGNSMVPAMTKGINNTGKAAIAGAIGSAAIAAAVMYVNRRNDKKKAQTPPVTPSGEPPQTD